MTTTTTTSPIDDAAHHARVCSALQAWIAQRPGLSFADYGDTRAYRAESRSITRDRDDALALLRVARWRTVTKAQWADAFRAYSGRLSWDGERLSYCTGQYWPTEYRRAACGVLASLLWHLAADAMPDASGYGVALWGERATRRFDTRAEAEGALAARGGHAVGHVVELYGTRPAVSAGDYLRAKFRSEFGRRIASRWFN